MKELIVLIAGIVWLCSARAQQNDTISGYHQTDDVLIVARPNDGWGPFNALTPLKRRQWISGDLGSFLDAQGMAHQLVAGAPGAAGSLRFHGLASDHSLLTWNGLPINSVTLGTCDMSLLPLFFFDEVRMRDTPSMDGTMQLGMGTTIQLASAAIEETATKAFSTYNSLGNSMLGVQSDWKHSRDDRHYTARVCGFYEGFENRYRYVDRYRIDKPLLWQHHQQGEYAGAQIDVNYMCKNNSLSFRSWLQSKSMELPVAMGSYAQGSAGQDDATLRSMMEYRWWKPRLQFDVQLAHTHERLYYTDSAYQIDSDIQSNMIWANGSLRWKPFKKVFVKGSVSRALVNVLNSNYADGRLSKPWEQYAIQLRYANDSHDLEGTASFEQRFGSSGWSSSMSYRYYLINSKSWSLSPFLTAARRYRLPDMNELFWSPGGNPHLKPELGYHGRAGWVAFFGKHSRTQWRLEPTVFFSRVNDWIQWIPAEGMVWTPVNYRKAQTQGAELYALCEKLSKNDRTRYRFETRWTLNDVFWVDSTSSEQLRRMIYSPRFMGYQGVSIQRDMHTLSIGYRYVSERFTDENNTPGRALSGYGLFNVWYMATVKRNTLDFEVSAGVDNVFNVAYETLRAYAMPGRIIRIGLNVYYRKKHVKSEITIE